ncbi:N-formylglutamate amidohydrolase [Alteriqipengyuania lutimaris]|uniref:N-formylglutamate amidohydrolase n=1 Tax=Alteriqipengyuania lutimaris TaxID=1538146 RepID=A0A395LK32_9SPHN|nr:N-formylglutamate amidohydrolase [Alteriqipengyuania lutimaris]RDS75824.1 N-formylglutamate amidohydrolase [Alteriqipengyuania lutimaris]
METPVNSDSHRKIDGGMIPGSGAPAFTLSGVSEARVPVLVAAPHGGRAYPRSLDADMQNPGLAKLRLEDRLVDKLALAVADQAGAASLVAHAPRAMLDLNRAADDIDWSMIGDSRPDGHVHSSANRRARSGLGLVPRRVAGVGEIWRRPLSQTDVAARIAGIHEPYHRALSRALGEIRRVWGVALLVDLHSMPPLRARHPGERAVEFVVGDRFGVSCGDAVSGRALHFLGQHDRGVAHNRPYAGGYVLDRHGKPALDIHALQLEVCRSLYLDARFESASARMPAVARLLAELVRALADEILSERREHGLPLAAE